MAASCPHPTSDRDQTDEARCDRPHWPAPSSLSPRTLRREDGRSGRECAPYPIVTCTHARGRNLAYHRAACVGRQVRCERGGAWVGARASSLSHCAAVSLKRRGVLIAASPTDGRAQEQEQTAKSVCHAASSCARAIVTGTEPPNRSITTFASWTPMASTISAMKPMNGPDSTMALSPGLSLGESFGISLRA